VIIYFSGVRQGMRERVSQDVAAYNAAKITADDERAERGSLVLGADQLQGAPAISEARTRIHHYHFFTTHAARIEEMLGGEASMITVVPSKRGMPYEKQPLRAARHPAAIVRLSGHRAPLSWLAQVPVTAIVAVMPAAGSSAPASVLLLSTWSIAVTCLIVHVPPGLPRGMVSKQLKVPSARVPADGS
jgi:hypothetical protein